MVLRRAKSWSLYVATVGGTLVIGWLLLAYSYRPHLQPHTFEDGSEGRIVLSQKEFVTAAISTTVEDDFDYSDIRKLCDAQSWDDTVVFKCLYVEGGIGKTLTS